MSDEATRLWSFAFMVVAIAWAMAAVRIVHWWRKR